MRKIHKELASLVSRGFDGRAINKKLNKNLVFRRYENGDVVVFAYGKPILTGCEKFGYSIILRAPFSQTFKGYINAILAGLGVFSNGLFYVKNYQIRNNAVKFENGSFKIPRCCGGDIVVEFGFFEFEHNLKEFREFYAGGASGVNLGCDKL